MSNIACQGLFQDVAQELGSGVESDRLKPKFIRAVNRALSELSLEADKSDTLDHITAVDSIITDMDTDYEWILYAGTIYNLVRMGVRPVDPKLARVVYDDSALRWAQAKAAYVVALDNANQATSTNDVWGLGYVGDT